MKNLNRFIGFMGDTLPLSVMISALFTVLFANGNLSLMFFIVFVGTSVLSSAILTLLAMDKPREKK